LIKKVFWRLERYALSLLAVLALLHAASYSSYSSTAEQMTFASPKEGVKAVIAACKSNDQDALLKIFGSDGKDIVESGDPSDDMTRRAAFVKLTNEKYKLIPNPMNADTMILSIGKEDYPFPIPLVRKAGRWSFDSSSGRQEILARRIGSNEMSAIEVGRGYVEAQFEYAQTHRPKGVPTYAQHIVSSPGQQDGLYWEPTKGAPECEVPKGFAQAAAGMSIEKREPYHGYYFRILTAQGPAAHGGAVNYIVNGSMIGGFALVAWPAEYGVSGIQTFIVNHDGVVYESHLGPETGRLGAEMTEFNPDSSWHPVQSEQP
jgi:hypothetical protein